MRRYKVIWTEAAVTDLEDLARYIARDSPANARRVMKRLHGRAESLQDFPERGRLVPELLDLGLRAWRELISDPIESSTGFRGTASSWKSFSMDAAMPRHCYPTAFCADSLIPSGRTTMPSQPTRPPTQAPPTP